MRRAARRDGNEAVLVRRLESYGFLWLPMSRRGYPDGVALRFGSTAWCEMKMPGESFTPEQVETFSAMKAKGVPVYVLETEEDVDDFARDALSVWTGEGITIRDAKKVHKGRREHRPGYDRARTVAESCVETFCPRSKVPGASLCAHHLTHGWVK